MSEDKKTNAHYDADGHLIHDNCALCGKGDAPFGIGVYLRKGELGMWFCRACKPRPKQ